MVLFKLPVKIRKLWMERTLGSADNCSISEEFGQAFPLQDGMVFLFAIRARTHILNKQQRTEKSLQIKWESCYTI